MSKSESLLRLKNGERQALSEVYNETKRAVYAVAFGILQNNSSAEDIMQETYIKVCENINSYTKNISSVAWVTRIAKNLAIDAYRKNKRMTSIDERYPDEKNDFDSVDNKIFAESIIEKARKILTKNEFLIVYLYTVGGLKHREIATILNKPPATVRWNYSNAINRIKNEIGD